MHALSHAQSARGHSVAPAAANGYCSHDCPGYYEDPKPGHYWPGEEAWEPKP